MASGVKVCLTTIEACKQVKLKKADLRFMILHIDQGLIKVLKSQPKDTSKTQEEEFNDFLSALPEDIGRFCILDLTVKQSNGAEKDILYQITWCPNGAHPKSHILYTTSKKEMKDKLGEGTIDIQANGLDDLIYDELLSRGSK